MPAPAHHRGGFAARRVRPDPAAVRQAWVELLAMAWSAGHAVSVDAAAPLGDLAPLARRRTALDFPVNEASARMMADSFLTAVRALAGAALPARRARYAAAVHVLALQLDGLIHDERAERAAGSWQGKAAGGDT